MDRFSFWYKWLLVITILITCFGFGISFLNQTPLFDSIVNVRVDSSFWSAESHPKGVPEFQAWIYGVLGATMGGWGISLVFITKNAFQKRETWAWSGLIVALSSWYLVDTAISLYFEVNFNAIFNTLILILVLLPLFSTRRMFFTKEA